jgi:8-oxo-dGTP pyrophosphatase MutT (NUDIX family)
MREVKEETGLETENLEFFGTRNYVFETTVDGNHMTRHNIELVYLITPKKGQVNLSEEHEAFAWVKSDEARNYDVFKELPNFIKEAELKLNKKC